MTARMSRSCLGLEVVANAALALERNISGAFGLIGVGSGVAGERYGFISLACLQE